MNAREQSSRLRGKGLISTSLLTQQHCVSNKSGNATNTILEYQRAGLEKRKTQAQRLEGSFNMLVCLPMHESKQNFAHRFSPDSLNRHCCGFRTLKIHPRSVVRATTLQLSPKWKPSEQCIYTELNINNYPHPLPKNTAVHSFHAAYSFKLNHSKLGVSQKTQIGAPQTNSVMCCK